MDFFNIRPLRIQLTRLSLVLMLAGCANYHGISSDKKIATPEQFATQKSIPEKDLGQWPSSDWVQQFGDAQLTEIVNEALANSPTIAQAQARLEKAMAFKDTTRSNTLPKVNADYSFSREIYSAKGLFLPPLGGTWYSQHNAIAQLSFDLDLWGKNRERLRAAVSSALAQQAETQQIKITLTASIVHAYIQLAEQEKNLAIANKQLAIQKNINRINHAQIQAGLQNHTIVKISQAQIANQQALIASYHQQIRQTRFQIAALIGKGPDRGLAIKTPQLRTTQTIELPNDIPANLIARRPDLVAAKWQVQSYRHQVKSTKAQFFPNINLMGSFGYNSFSWRDLFTPLARQSQFGPAISLPIFDAGALRAQLRGSYSNFNESVAKYNKTLIDALNDVATQIASIRSINQQIVQASNAFHYTKQNAQLIEQRYQAGLLPYLSVLNEKTSLLNAAQNVMQLKMARHNLQVNLITALGGGFHQTPPSDQQTQTPHESDIPPS